MCLRACEVLGEPGGLDQRQAHRHDALELAGLQPLPQRLLQQRLGAGLAQPHAHPAEHGQRRQVHDHGQSLQAHDAGRDGLCLAEAALLHAELRLPADQVLRRRIQIVPDGEGDALGEQPLGQREVLEHDRVFGEVGVGPRRMIVKAVLERQRQALLHPLAAARAVGEEQRRADIVQGVHARLDLAQPIGQRDRPLVPIRSPRRSDSAASAAASACCRPSPAPAREADFPARAPPRSRNAPRARPRRGASAAATASAGSGRPCRCARARARSRWRGAAPR